MDDFDRPLSERGRRAAPAMAAWLAGKGWRPDVVLCSAAVRTQETLRLAAPHLDPGPVLVDRRLYLASAATLLRHVEALDDAYARALVIAHNPGLELLAQDLDRGDGPASEALAGKFPTAAMAWFRSDSDTWRAFTEARVALVAFRTPADLERPGAD